MKLANGHQSLAELWWYHPPPPRCSLVCEGVYGEDARLIVTLTILHLLLREDGRHVRDCLFELEGYSVRVMVTLIA